MSNLRLAIRSMLAQPAWTLIALLCLAIGTAANTAGLSVIEAIFFRPLPFPEPDRIVAVVVLPPDQPRVRPFSLAEFRDLEALASPLAELSARSFLPASVSSRGSAARMTQSELVSLNYFDMLRVKPLLGRFFDPQAAPEPAEAVMSERLWRSRFAADPSILGQTINVNAHSFIVAGIAPEGFIGVTQLIGADLWIPASFYSTLIAAPSRAEAEATPWFGVMGRLRPGATAQQAQLQLDSFEAALAQSRGVAAPLTMLVTPANGVGFGAAANAAALGGSAFVLSLTGLVLAVSVANVAGLLLARAVARRREISLKLALGAAPGVIIRQVLMESAVLGLAGTTLGVLLGAALFQIPGNLVTLPEHLVYAIDFHPDARVFLLGVLTSLGVTVLFGLIPALHAGRTDVMDALRQSAGGGRTPSALRALSILAVGQMAICTVFLVGAGILTRTYWNSENAEPGFETRNALGVTLDLTQGGYDQAGGRRVFASLLRNAAALPGVESVSLTREAPLAPLARTVSVRSGEGASTNADSKVISPDHFKTLRIPFLAGRDFTPSDSGVAIVNQKLAEQLWPGASPLGKTFRLGDPSAAPVEVIGVVRDTHYRSLLEDPHAEFYQPLSQTFAPQMTMLIRSAADPSRLMEAVRQMIRAENPALAAVDIRTLAAVREASISSRRITAGILTSICVAGLLLSAAGLYGVIAFAVRNRAREFGIRMALGARRSDVLGMVLARGLRLASIGFLIGAVLSFGLARLLASLITGVQANDPLTLVVVSCILAVTALAASFWPARWATRVDPAVALRND